VGQALGKIKNITIMKSTITFFILLLVLLSLLIGCKKTKCVHNQVAHLTLSQNDRLIDPYIGNETLIFKNANGDSIVLTNGSRTTGTTTLYEYAQSYADEYHDGCTGDYFSREYDDLNISSQDDSNLITITIAYNYWFNNPDTTKSVNFYFNTKDSKGWCFVGHYGFRNDSIISLHDKYDSVVAYHNLISIGPKSFTNVTELYFLCTDPKCVEWYCTAYYSVKEGFVGLQSNFGTMWYLDRKQ
jgi:hypothetical protein